MIIHESGEMYLETILILHNRSGFVRSIDVANELNYSKASVSRAMGILKKAELISIEIGGKIVLTEKGMAKANEIYERHNIITHFLIKALNLDDELASKDACKIEHIISPETFAKMKDYIMSE